MSGFEKAPQVLFKSGKLKVYKTRFDWNEHLRNLLEKILSVYQHFVEEIE